MFNSKFPIYRCRTGGSEQRSHLTPHNKWERVRTWTQVSLSTETLFSLLRRGTAVIPLSSFNLRAPPCVTSPLRPDQSVLFPSHLSSASTSVSSRWQLHFPSLLCDLRVPQCVWINVHFYPELQPCCQEKVFWLVLVPKGGQIYRGLK